MTVYSITPRLISIHMYEINTINPCHIIPYGVPPNSRQQTTMHSRGYHRGQPLLAGYARYQKQSSGENGRRERPVPDAPAPRGNEGRPEPVPSNGNQPVHTELPSEASPIQHTQDQPPLEVTECHEVPSTPREAPTLDECEGDDILTENSSAAPDINTDYDNAKKAPSPGPRSGTSEPQIPTHDTTKNRDTQQPFYPTGEPPKKTGRRKSYSR